MNRKKFSQIYDQYIEKIYRFVFLKVNSRETAEDLTSETFLRAWESFEKGQEIENIQAFLYRIARNLVTDYYRKKGRTRIVSTEMFPGADPRQNLEEKSLLESEIERIRLALTNLKEDYQNVIIWHYLDGLSITEAAQLLDRTEEATRVLLSRALKALKNQLNQDCNKIREKSS